MAAISSLVLTGSALVPSAAQAAETCHGQEATVTPSDGRLVGTDGPDVIVSRGLEVDAQRGADLICLKGSGGVRVNAGGGNDTVDAASAGGTIIAALGLGDDSYLGSPGRDWVRDGQPHRNETAQDGRDVIDTGGGADLVSASSEGRARPETISTGSGRDDVRLGSIHPDARLDVGTGRNVLGAGSRETGAVSWSVDAGTRTIVRDGSVWSWDGKITDFFLFPRLEPKVSLLTFMGTDRDEFLLVGNGGRDGFPVSFDMGAGDDRTRVATGKGVAASHFDGGPGRDWLRTGIRRPLVRFDLEQRRLDFGPHDPNPGTVAGLENLSVEGQAVRVMGSIASEVLNVRGCNLKVLGGPGRDDIRLRHGLLPRCEVDAARGRGGTGPDRLIGTDRLDDVLVGDDGLDMADGRGGIDTCRAEVTRNCERS